MVINQIVILVLGTIGNIVTLVAIPYVRIKYGNQFSILQLNSMILILHLSFCDLLYCLVGFPFSIHAYLTGPDVIYDDNLCSSVALIRNLVAHADFNTVAMIACCVARQNMCRKCVGVGNSLRHDQHDALFGGRKIYFICLLIW